MYFFSLLLLNNIHTIIILPLKYLLTSFNILQLAYPNLCNWKCIFPHLSKLYFEGNLNIYYIPITKALWVLDIFNIQFLKLEHLKKQRWKKDKNFFWVGDMPIFTCWWIVYYIHIITSWAHTKKIPINSIWLLVKKQHKPGWNKPALLLCEPQS